MNLGEKKLFDKQIRKWHVEIDFIFNSPNDFPDPSIAAHDGISGIMDSSIRVPVDNIPRTALLRHELIFMKNL